jgi:catechol 2,3-dioxygenase-like lactoylglutathione lyase family enzyme
MTFRYLTVFVADVTRTLAFWEAAFGLRSAFVHESGQYAELATGETKLAFSAHALAREIVAGDYAQAAPDRPPLGFEIGLKVDDARAAYARALAAGGGAHREPAQMPWGQTIAYVRDPDGTLVVLVEGE